MSDTQVPMIPAASEAPALTPVQRVIYTFTAPSKTFTDIKRNTSWWLPFLISIVFTYALFAGINAKVGWQTVAENNMKLNPKQAERFEQLPADQRASQLKIIAVTTEAFMAGSPIIALIGSAIIAGVMLASINFGFGGKATFWQAFAVTIYAGLPGIFKLLLGTIALFVGLDPDSFKINNFAGTNIGYFLPPDSNKALLALATSIDITTIWTLVLASIGISIVAGTKRSSGYIVIFGWWILIVLIGTGWAAAFS